MTIFPNITEADVKKLNKSLNTDFSKDDVLDIIQSNQEQNNNKQNNITNALNLEKWISKAKSTIFSINGEFDIILDDGSRKHGYLDIVPFRIAQDQTGFVGKAQLTKLAKIVKFETIKGLIKSRTPQKNIYEDAHSLLISKYHLNDTNGYVYIDKKHLIEFIVEAKNNASINIDIDQLKTAKTTNDVLRIIANEMLLFNADDEFNLIWSKEFGEQNNVSHHHLFKCSLMTKINFKKLQLLFIQTYSNPTQAHYEPTCAS